MDRGSTDERDRAANRARGLLIVAVGVLLLSPDALFIRLLDMDNWTLLFFRGALTMVGFLVLLRAMSGPLLRRDLWALGKAGVAVACLLVVANVGFVTSIRATDATVVLVVVSSAPMFALIIGRLFTSEVAPRRTWIASATVLAGVAAIFMAEAQGEGVSGALAALGGPSPWPLSW
ncbi:MAG: EamA family transporter [Solirubrobacterales bacterium]